MARQFLVVSEKEGKLTEKLDDCEVADLLRDAISPLTKATFFVAYGNDSIEKVRKNG